MYVGIDSLGLVAAVERQQVRQWVNNAIILVSVKLALVSLKPTVSSHSVVAHFACLIHVSRWLLPCVIPVVRSILSPHSSLPLFPLSTGGCGAGPVRGVWGARPGRPTAGGRAGDASRAEYEGGPLCPLQRAAQ
jgi:hypothetical protein